MKYAELRNPNRLNCCMAAIIAVLVTAAAASGAEETARLPETAVIRIGKRTITKAAIDARTRQIALKRRQEPSEKEISTLVGRLAEQTLFAEEARALGLDKDEKVQVLIQDTVDKLLANLYVRGHLLPSVQVSETEAGEYYKARQNMWKQPETVKARHILLRVKAADTADAVRSAENRALDIRKRLLAGEDFAELAGMYSEDTGTRDKGGDLGFFTRKGKAAAISDAVFSMKDGEISRPVRSSVGYHILQRVEHRPPGVKPYEEVQADIRSRLLREKQRRAARADRERLEKKYNMRIHPSYRLSEASDEK